MGKTTPAPPRQQHRVRAPARGRDRLKSLHMPANTPQNRAARAPTAAWRLHRGTHLHEFKGSGLVARVVSQQGQRAHLPVIHGHIQTHRSRHCCGAFAASKRSNHPLFGPLGRRPLSEGHSDHQVQTGPCGAFSAPLCKWRGPEPDHSPHMVWGMGASGMGAPERGFETGCDQDTCHLDRAPPRTRWRYPHGTAWEGPRARGSPPYPLDEGDVERRA